MTDQTLLRRSRPEALSLLVLVAATIYMISNRGLVRFDVYIDFIAGQSGLLSAGFLAFSRRGPDFPRLWRAIGIIGILVVLFWTFADFPVANIKLQEDVETLQMTVRELRKNR